MHHQSQHPKKLQDTMTPWLEIMNGIVKTEDFSMKALDKPLSAYSSIEMENLPMNIKKECRVVVPTDISKEELKATLIRVVIDKTLETILSHFYIIII